MSPRGDAGARVIDLPGFADDRGHLAFFESRRHVPFTIGTPTWWSAATRADGASEQSAGTAAMLLALSGILEVRVSTPDGPPQTMRLERPTQGLLVPASAHWEVQVLSDPAVGLCVREAATRAAGAAGVGQLPQPTRVLSAVADCRVVPLPTREDPATALSPLVVGQVPFRVVRLYYLYGIPAGQRRGGHAHKELHQMMVAVAGSFEIQLDDGNDRVTVRLDRPDHGLYIPPMIWRDLSNFSPDAVCLVLASLPYAEAEYIRDHEAFVQARRSGGGGARRADA